MHRNPAWALTVACVMAALIGGCSTSPPPQSAPPPPAPPPGNEGYINLTSGASDSVGSLPGSADALYRYRFTASAPLSDRFTFQDRELSFYFKPTPDALHFQVENRLSRPVVIDWDRSAMLDPDGHRDRIAHATTAWRDRFSTLGRVQINGLQEYSDYLFPLDYLVDPAGSDQQLHRPLLPEDSRAPQYANKDFGVELAFVIDDRPRTYSFAFRVASVIPISR